MKPDPCFVKKLHAYDPDLRVVWSQFKECWLIERRVRRARFDYGDSPDPDVQRRYRDGYVHVGNVPPRDLNELVLLNLWKSDMWRQGGAKYVNAMIDDYYAEHERKVEKNQADDLRYLAGDMWDSIAWKRGGRIRVPEGVPVNG